MNKEKHELIIIGGGPAGIAAAISAYESGVKDILIIERDNILGGILNQCIHNGFGLHCFKEELTGPEYAGRYVELLKETKVKVLSNTMVTSLNEKKEITAINFKGVNHLSSKAIILAMGCRERSRGAISIPGDRVAGVITAGAAQRYCNIDGYLVGKKVVILGSGDIGLITARRLTLEGAKVLAVVEICPYSNGLNRNIVQCLNDFDIPLYLSHTVSNIKANKNHTRVEEVIISKVDENKNIIPNTEISFKCDTLLLSVGLIPENELSIKAGIILDPRTKGALVSNNLETSVEGIFACGNVLQVHDLVDNVSLEGERAGISAATYIKEGNKNSKGIKLEVGENLLYLCPQIIKPSSVVDSTPIFFRVKKPLDNCKINIIINNEIVSSINKIKLIPSEMQSVNIRKDMLKGIKNIKIEVIEK